MVVYAKDRKETATQYIITAQNLQEKVLRYMMNEKRVPKKWRYLSELPMDLQGKKKKLEIQALFTKSEDGDKIKQ